VLYFEQWLTRPGCALSASPDGPPPLRLKYIRLDPAPKTVGPRETYFAFLQSGGRQWRGEHLDDSRRLDVRSSIVGLGVPGRKPSVEYDFSHLAGGALDLGRGGVVRGDVRCEVWHKDKKLLRFWFHTAFIEGGALRLNKAELDGPHKDRKAKHFDDEFHVELFFEVAPSSDLG